ncbi:MAG: protein phosphatase 2C domain-containing protein [Myxococcales bacterium]|nr:protein phosphatase 2C domain-containing protein [Myxococcales bacterium]MCB9733512.1 protein phosphatase 2C domain-containing protein [Deltaproteobacteria bacterium]
MTVTFSARTDVGKLRSNNEDNFLVDRKLKLYIVCDGMGGHQGGEIASATAVNVVRETLLRRRDVIDGFEYADGRYEEGDVLALIEDAVHVANQRVHERGQSNPAQRGMGTTLSLLLLARDRAFIAHVGDTRIYRRRGGELTRLTDDHSLVNEMARTMNVDADSVDPRLKNAITRAVGVHAVVEVDARYARVEPGDRFLLCSDGLHGLVTDEEIAFVLGQDDLVQAADELIDRANAAGGRDNITALVVQVSDAPSRVSAEERMMVAEALRRAPLFQGLTDLELRRLATETEQRRLGPGERLVQQGQHHSGLIVVGAGAVEVSRGGTVVGLLEAGDVFGEDALFDDTLSPVTLAAKEDAPALVLGIRPAGLETLRIEAPMVALKLVTAVARALAHRVQDAARLMPNLSPLFRSAEASTRVMTRPRQAERAKAETLPASFRPKASPRPDTLTAMLAATGLEERRPMPPSVPAVAPQDPPAAASPPAAAPAAPVTPRPAQSATAETLEDGERVPDPPPSERPVATTRPLERPVGTQTPAAPEGAEGASDEAQPASGGAAPPPIPRAPGAAGTPPPLPGGFEPEP